MRDRDGITSLMYACYHGHAGAVSVLLNAGADFILKDTFEVILKISELIIK